MNSQFNVINVILTFFYSSWDRLCSNTCWLGQTPPPWPVCLCHRSHQWHIVSSSLPQHPPESATWTCSLPSATCPLWGRTPPLCSESLLGVEESTAMIICHLTLIGRMSLPFYLLSTYLKRMDPSIINCLHIHAFKPMTHKHAASPAPPYLLLLLHTCPM